MKSFKILTFVFVILACFAFCACDNNPNKEPVIPTPSEYTITFNYDGGEGAETTRKVEYGLRVNDLPEVIAPLGKTFAGWKTEDGLSFTNGTVYNFEKDITVVADYTINVYSIVYDVAGGNALPTDAITTYSISATAIALPTPTREGYEFKGWNDGTKVITAIAAGTVGNLSLTATWQANTYTITFNYNGGEGAETTRSVEYGSAVNDLPEVIAPLGKTFAGWKTEDGLLISNGTLYSFKKDISLIANYNTDAYTISYFVAGGNALPTDAITTYSISATAIALPTATRAGYEFKGWNDGTKVITKIAAGTVGNLSLTATWQANTYTITFNYNGGEGTETTRDVEYGSSVNDLPEVIAPLGKTFAGWKTEDGLSFTNGTVYNFEQGITITADYTINVYSIVYDVAGGNALPTDSITTYSISETAITLPTPTRADYEFKGWNDGTKVITEIAAGTVGNLSLTATWQAVGNRFTVILQNKTKASFTAWQDGTEGEKTVYVDINSKLVVPPIVYDSLSETIKQNNDYYFSGWYYKDKTGKETKLDLSTSFTLQNLNVETYVITVYAKVSKQWAGPY